MASFPLVLCMNSCEWQGKGTVIQGAPFCSALNFVFVCCCKAEKSESRRSLHHIHMSRASFHHATQRTARLHLHLPHSFCQHVQDRGGIGAASCNCYHDH